jgi:hypothetical protein
MIGKALQLSTAHHPFDAIVPNDVARSTTTEYGMVVWCTEERDSMPEWLVPIMDMADTYGCFMIEFDADNDTVQGLRVFDW